MKIKLINLMLTIACLGGLSCTGLVHAERHALLIGIGQYGAGIPSLEGPPNDIFALKRILVEKWNFKTQHITDLINGAATRSRILRELAALKTRTQPGDHIFIYYSGHGTSALDPDNRLPLPHTSGAILPADFKLGGSNKAMLKGLLIGRRDLRPLFVALDRLERKIFVAMDTCYSGNTVRSLFRSAMQTRALPTRFVALKFRGVPGALDADLGGFGSATKKSEAYPYRNVYYLSASGEHEQAADIDQSQLNRYPTIDNKPHGAFTDALMRVLSGEVYADTNHDGTLTYDELKLAVRRFMGGRGYSHTPNALPLMANDTQQLATRSVFERKGGVKEQTQKAGRVLRVKLVNTADELRKRIEAMPNVVFDKTAPDLTIKRDRDSTLLISKAGDLLARMDTTDPARIIARIRQQVWIKRLIRPGHKGQKFNLSLDVTGQGRGGVVVKGQAVGFTLKSERPAHILLLDIDPGGNVHVLYPYHQSETRPIQANKVLRIPESKVIEPYGTEQLVAFAFEKLPQGIGVFMGKSIAPGSSLLAELERMLNKNRQGSAKAALTLVTVGSRSGQ